MASPPVPESLNSGSRNTLGLLFPDYFKFGGIEPHKEITFDYNILKPTYLSYVDVDFGNCIGDVDHVPINTICPEFPHKNGKN